ncbi:hypothetical protein MMC21_003668 [Puttea exsequens]|nr:hypothetical protein [Puttea exsequens]
MDRSISKDLDGLLPGLTGSLPPELVELAISLLAQSRSKASTLKAEEEIARSYACSNLACERLKQSLALPRIEPRPPCPPRVYQKLYRYLSSALPAGTRRNNKPARANDPFSAPASSPAKPRIPGQVIPLRSGSMRKKTSLRPNARSDSVPDWIMPSIRQMCKKVEAPAAPHHIFAGVSSILSLRELERNGGAEAASSGVKTAALIVAIYILVATRLIGVETKPAEYRQRRRLALEALTEAIPGEMEQAFDDSDVNKAMRKIDSQRWAEMDWFSNVPEGSGLCLEVEMDEVSSQGAAKDGEDEEDEGPLLPGLRRASRRQDDLVDSLFTADYDQMQDRVDYLSDKRRQDFRKWKKNILIQIKELENAEETDVEAG